MFQFMMGPSVFNENGIVILEVSVCILCYGCNTIDLKNKKKIQVMKKKSDVKKLNESQVKNPLKSHKN